MCLGHESSGYVVRLGANVAAQSAAAEKAASELSNGDHTKEEAKQVVGKRALNIGDKVTMEPGSTCRMCSDCRGGQYNVCHHAMRRESPALRIVLDLRAYGFCRISTFRRDSATLLQAVSLSGIFD